MRIIFLGVGEACDERYPNTSILIYAGDSGKQRSVLLDCGFNVPFAYWARVQDPEELDAVWISHFHGDHCFGIPVFLLRLWEMERRKPLCILGQEGVREHVERMMDLAYPGFRHKLTYDLQFQVVETDGAIHALGFHWAAAQNEHGQRCLALRLERRGKALFYSGDGRPTVHTRLLARGCQLVIHEAFAARNSTVPGHGTVQGCIEFAAEAGAEKLAVVHIQRDVRRNQLALIQEMLSRAAGMQTVLPEPGDELFI